MWKWVKAGRLPEPRYVKAGEPCWRLGELIALLKALSKMEDAPRGFKTSRDDRFPVETTGRKGRNLWERLGLASPNQV